MIAFRFIETMSDIQRFDPDISSNEVDRLFRKLKDTRIPKDSIVPDAGQDYGTSIDHE